MTVENRKFYFDFERLNVYQKSLEFIDKIFEIYKALPQDYKFALGANLLRAGLSIANNLAEGNGKSIKKKKLAILELRLIQQRNVFQYLMCWLDKI